MNEALEHIKELTIKLMEHNLNSFIRENDDCDLRIDVTDGSISEALGYYPHSTIIRKGVKAIRFSENFLIVKEEHDGGYFVASLEKALAFQITVGNEKKKRSYIVKGRLDSLEFPEIIRSFVPSDQVVCRAFDKISRMVRVCEGPCLLKVIYFLEDGKTKEISDTLTSSNLPQEECTNVFKATEEIDLNIPSNCSVHFILSEISPTSAKILFSFSIERNENFFFVT